MKAAQYAGFTTDYNDVKLVTVPKPEVKPGYALVKVSYAAVNPVDTVIMKGYFKQLWPHPAPNPFTIGVDFAGIVEAVGDDVSNVAAGDEVFGVSWGPGTPADGDDNGGAFAEYILFKAVKLIKKPAALPFTTAAGLGVIVATAGQNLFKIGQVKPGTKILIFGASSAVGLIAVQWAKIVGAWVATTCSSRTLDVVKTLGADKIINYTEEKWEDDTELRNLDVIFDTIGEKDGLERTVKNGVVKPDGIYVSIANYSIGFDPKGHPPLSYAAFSSVAPDNAYLEEAAKLITEGKMKAFTDEVFPFTQEGVVEILKKIDGGKSVGKNLLKIGA